MFIKLGDVRVNMALVTKYEARTRYSGDPISWDGSAIVFYGVDDKIIHVAKFYTDTEFDEVLNTLDQLTYTEKFD